MPRQLNLQWGVREGAQKLDTPILMPQCLSISHFLKNQKVRKHQAVKSQECDSADTAVSDGKVLICIQGSTADLVAWYQETPSNHKL